MSDKFTPAPEMMDEMVAAMKATGQFYASDNRWECVLRAALRIAIPMIAEECAKAAEDVAGGCHGEPDYQTVTEACAAFIRAKFSAP